MSKNKLVDISIIFIALVLVFVILNKFQGFLRPFVIAIVLSFLLVPVSRLSKERKIFMVLNTLVTTIVLIIGVVLVGSFFSGESSQIEKIPEEDESFKQSLDSFYSNTNMNLFGQEIDLGSVIPKDELGGHISKLVSNIINSLSSLFGELFLVILFLMFILPSHDSMINRISKKLSSKESKKFKGALDDIEKSIRSYLVIKSIISFGTAFFSLVIMIMFGVKFAFIFSLMIFIFNFIPSIGSIIAVLAVLLSELVLSGLDGGLIALGVLLILIQILFGNVIEPKFAGKQLEISPVIILLSLFFWGSIWGVGGMLLAVPLTSIIKITLQHIDSTKKIVPFLS